MSEEYIPAEQGIELLGEKASKFYYHVDRGEITTETPARPGKGKKNNRYLVTDILKVKTRLLKQRQKRRPAPLIDWLYTSDVPAGLRLDMQVYPGEVDLATIGVYQGWRRNNPHLTLACYNADRSEVYATMQCVPLAEKVILDVLAGRREESSITPEEIQSYDRPGAYTLLCTSVTALKDRPQLLYELLYRYTEFWLEMFPDRYIRKIYAQTVSESGIMLAQHMFMSPRRDLAVNAFELDMQFPPASKLIRRFKDQLAAKAPLPDDLRWPPVESHTPQPLHRFIVDREYPQ